MSRNRKAKKAPKSTGKSKSREASYLEKVKKTFKERGKQTSSGMVFNYHSIPFSHFHSKVRSVLIEEGVYRREFWTAIPNGIYDTELAIEHLKRYKAFIENKMRQIIEKYSISYWLHVARRIAPNTMGDDHRHETIEICRNIITAAIQKYGMLSPCGTIKLSTNVKVEDIFKGLLLKKGFENVKKNILDAPAQLVLTEFDEKNILEYYELERLAFEMWYAGSKSRIISKGANLVIDHKDPHIVVDNRSEELSELISNFDQRAHVMYATATGTVFLQPKSGNEGNIYVTQILTDRSSKYYSDPVTEWLDIEFPSGHFPNYQFTQVDIRTYFHVHVEFAVDFFKRWNIRYEFVIAVITDICLSYTTEIISDKNLVTAMNIMLRSYQIYDLGEFKKGLAENWRNVVKYLQVELDYDENEINRTIDYLTLTNLNRTDIFVDSFGPLKIFIPGAEPGSIFIDHSIIGEFLYNMFYDLPLSDRKFKGQLLEDALKNEKSYLPVTELKGLDGTSKQVDFSFVRGDVLVLAECKAVARSFGVFGGQSKAIEHRRRNVIDKGINDVDAKVKWLQEHRKGTNYDISHLKYIVGVVVSPFTEFINSKSHVYWLNDNLPRVLNIREFSILLKADLKKVIKKNLLIVNV